MLPNVFHAACPPSEVSASWVSKAGLVFGPLLLVGWLWCEPADLAVPAQYRLGGILQLTILWWLTEPVPISITGLLAVVLAVVCGAVPVDPSSNSSAAKVAFAPFADSTVFFLLGGMFLGRAMSRQGLDRRFALTILTARWAGRSPASVSAAVGCSVMLLSMWISNTAATAMVYPVTLGILAVLGQAAPEGADAFLRSRYATALLLTTAYASSVGGIATPIGTTTNVVAMGYFRKAEYFGQSVDFLRWSLVGVPLMSVLGVALFCWMYRGIAREKLDLVTLGEYLRSERAKLRPWSQGERNALAIFLIVVLLWILPALAGLVGASDLQTWLVDHLPEEVVALLAPILGFLLPVDWRRGRFTLSTDDLSEIDWGTILLFGAGLSLGNLMLQTGLAKTIGTVAFDRLGSHDMGLITALAIAGGILLSEFTSNAATAATLIPVVAVIARDAQIELLPPLMGVTLAASFGSALPVSTPPNAIVYGSRLIPARRMIRAGVGFDLICGVVIWIVLRVALAAGWTPFLGQS